MIYGYCRGSTKNQSLQRQINSLVNYGVDERFIFLDKYIGKTLERSGLNKLLSVVKEGDTIVIKEIYRLGRNREETKDLIVFFIKKDIEIICLDMPYLKEFIIEKIKENKGFMEIMANVLLDVILEVAELERKKIVNRTSGGRKLGRKSKVSIQVFNLYYKKFLNREMKAIEIQKELNISKQSYYNYIEILKNKSNEV